MGNIILLVLGIQLIIYPNISDVCGQEGQARGCYDVSKNIIYISQDHEADENLFYHELGHALFYGNAEARNLARQSGDDALESARLEEKLADSFAEYFLNAESLRRKNPPLSDYFEDCLGILSYFYGA